MRYFIYFFFLFSFLFSFSQNGKIVKVKDGDTFVLLDSLNVQHVIRIADIDCPEKGQPFGNVAKNYLSNLIFGKNIYVQKKYIDKYGRTIGNVFFKDENIAFKLLENGLAWHYKYYSDDKFMSDLEDNAKKNKKGLWIDKNPINPYNWRKGQRN